MVLVEKKAFRNKKPQPFKNLLNLILVCCFYKFSITVLLSQIRSLAICNFGFQGDFGTWRQSKINRQLPININGKETELSAPGRAHSRVHARLPGTI